MQSFSKYQTCAFGHSLCSLCTDQDCESPSPICQNQECQTNKLHQNCFNRIPVKDVAERLLQKSNSTIHSMDDLIMKFYVNTIKQLEIDKQEYIRTKRAQQYKLDGDELKLFKLIKEGPSNKIFPQLVIKVSKSLKQPKEPSSVNSSFSQDSINPLKRETGAIAEVIKGMLTKLKLKWSTTEQDNQPYRQPTHSFSSQLCSKDVFEISNQGKKIKRTLPFDQIGQFALITPSNDILPKKIQLRMKNISENLLIGIAYKDIVKKNNFQCLNTLGGGFYGICNDGDAYSHHDKKVNSNSTEFRCVNGDVIEIECDIRRLKLRFVNKSRPQHKTEMDFQKPQGTSIHYCIEMHAENTEVEII